MLAKLNFYKQLLAWMTHSDFDVWVTFLWKIETQVVTGHKELLNFAWATNTQIGKQSVLRTVNIHWMKTNMSHKIK